MLMLTTSLHLQSSLAASSRMIISYRRQPTTWHIYRCPMTGLCRRNRHSPTGKGLIKKERFRYLVYGPSNLNNWESASYPGVDNAIVSVRSENTRESRTFVQFIELRGQ